MNLNEGSSEPLADPQRSQTEAARRTEGSLQCTECDKAFKRKEILLIHCRAHTGDRPHRCDRCGKSFLLRSALLRHHREHMGPSKDNGSNISCSSTFSDKSWNQCLESNATSTRKTGLNIQTGKKSHRCTVCNKGFANSYSYMYHM